jgi:hypothetical protein
MGLATDHSLIINGFEIDTVNPRLKKPSNLHPPTMMSIGRMNRRCRGLRPPVRRRISFISEPIPMPLRLPP